MITDMEMPVTTPVRLSVQEYLRQEVTALEKHEYRNGEVVGMAGGTPEHSLIIMNFGGELRNRLKGGPCRVYESNLRIHIPRDSLYTYPDLSVICGQLQLDRSDRTRTTVTNPRVLVEVLSRTTEGYDRGDKFRQYLTIDTLEEYVLVSQALPRIETFFRQPDGAWMFTHAMGVDAVVKIRSFGIDVPLSETYAGIVFPPEPEPTEPQAF